MLLRAPSFFPENTAKTSPSTRSTSFICCAFLSTGCLRASPLVTFKYIDGFLHFYRSTFPLQVVIYGAKVYIILPDLNDLFTKREISLDCYFSLFKIDVFAIPVTEASASKILWSCSVLALVKFLTTS